MTRDGSPGTSCAIGEGAEGWLGSSRVESQKGILDKIKMSHENGSNFDD